MILKSCTFTFALISLFQISYESFAQSQSDFALIRGNVFTNPLTPKLTMQVTQTHWDIDLFAYPLSSSLSYIALPDHEVLSGAYFILDGAWHRIVYIEGLDNWVREYGTYGSGNNQMRWATSIDALGPCDEEGYSNYYYIYVADRKNSRILRLRYNWASESFVWDNPITGLGLSRPVDISLHDGRSFYNIGEDDFPSVQDNYLWVVNSPSGMPYEIKRFTVNGVLKKTYGIFGCEGAENSFCKITAIVAGRNAFQAAPYANSNFFYVSDVGNQRIVMLNKEENGENIYWWDEITCDTGIVDLEVDHFGHVWALNRITGTITKYTDQLYPLCKFGSTGIGENQFINPFSISDPVGFLGAANMFIWEDWTDSSGGQYFGIGTDIVDLSVTASFDQYFHYFNFVLISPSKVRINVYNSQATLVKSVLNASILSGECMYSWNGKNSSGVEQATGEYRVEIIDSATTVNSTTGEPTNVVTKEVWFHHEFNCCNADGIRGDVNNICNPSCINVQDITYLTQYIFQGGPPPPCPAEGNVDGIGNIGILDLTYLVDRIFRGGPPPPACP